MKITMELKDQVCSLELAKRLKELGFKQDSLFYWGQPRGQESTKHFILIYEQRLDVEMFNTWHLFSAYTVAELEEMLPKGYRTSRSERGWIAYASYGGPNIEAETEADARAEYLIHLSEQNLISIN